MRYLNYSAVPDLLKNDEDIQDVIEVDQHTLYQMLSDGSLVDDFLYLCDKVAYRSAVAGENYVEAPQPLQSAAAYLRVAHNEFTTEYALYWDTRWWAWVVRITQCENGEVTHDTDDANRYLQFDAAWSKFCEAAGKLDAGPENGIALMKMLYEVRDAAPDKPARTAPRPSNFGTWS